MHSHFLKDRKIEIAEIAALSRLLGMIPSDNTIQISEPMTDHTMALSDWLNEPRDSFLKLSVLICKELDIQLQWAGLHKSYVPLYGRAFASCRCSDNVVESS